MAPKKKATQTAPIREVRYQRPWELGDPAWEVTPTEVPPYYVWDHNMDFERLETTLDSLRQGELWLSNSLRLLAQSVSEDTNARDELIYELRERIGSLKWRLDSIEADVKTLNVTMQAQQDTTRQLAAQLGDITTRLEHIEARQSHAPSARADSETSELRQTISDQLMRMAAIIGCRIPDNDPIIPSVSVAEQIRAAQNVARVLRTPPVISSIPGSRASSPAPSMHRGI
jgi:septal ring factor EnvC (AmiA/AmiB activator)